jgi:hypothetical protein
MKILRYILIGVLTLFGLLTLFLSTSVIFNLFGIRAMEGDFVMFVVVANFISSVLYLLSVYGLVMFQKWLVYLLGISSVILIIAFIGLKLHINAGGLYEFKTVNAMIFRSSLTVLFTVLAYITLNNKYSNKNLN